MLGFFFTLRYFSLTQMYNWEKKNFELDSESEDMAVRKHESGQQQQQQYQLEYFMFKRKTAEITKPTEKSFSFWWCEACVRRYRKRCINVRYISFRFRAILTNDWAWEFARSIGSEQVVEERLAIIDFVIFRLVSNSLSN